MQILRALYSGVMVAARPLFRLKLRWRARREAAYRQCIAERFGRYSVPQPNGHVVWIHAVSLGEAKAAAALIAALHQEHPQLKILLTHCTATGREAGAALMRPGSDVQAWLPWDDVASVRAFYAHFCPRLGIIMETEVWPNLIFEARALGIPLVLANARMSAKSQKGFARFPGLSHAMFGAFARVLAQSPADAQRLYNLGAILPIVTGNLKFDLQPDTRQLELGRHWRQNIQTTVLAFVNTRPGEEAVFLQACQSLRSHLQGVQLLLVPRHPQRFAEVARLAQEAGFAVVQRSQWPVSGPQPQAASVWLGDSVGEMALYYGLADVALMGGSFERYGAHNLIEACACSVPVWVGPHTYNFAQAVQDGVQAHAVMAFSDIQAALADALKVLKMPDNLLQMRAHAANFAAMHTGAIAKNMAQLHQAAPALFL